MAEIATGVGTEDGLAGDKPEVEITVRGLPDPCTPSEDELRKAAVTFISFGHWLQWCLLLLGILCAVDRGLELSAGVSPATPDSTWVKILLEGLALILGFGLAGVCGAAACKLAGVALVARHERETNAGRLLITQATRAADLLEEFLLSRGSQSEELELENNAKAQRAVALAEIDRSLGLGQWTESESLIGAFSQRYPQDSKLGELRDRLHVGRQQALQDQMALLDAARKVNDPARVIELYQAVVPSLDVDRRQEVAADLAKWFLDLIHRRLRTGRIQAEVVLLATQVAETFATTVEGASMRAALPTLRRSVGLCARCAEPYTGTADACPRCLTGGGRPSAVSHSSETPPTS